VRSNTDAAEPRARARAPGVLVDWIGQVADQERTMNERQRKHAAHELARRGEPRCFRHLVFLADPT